MHIFVKTLTEDDHYRSREQRHNRQCQDQDSDPGGNISFFSKYFASPSAGPSGPMRRGIAHNFSSNMDRPPQELVRDLISGTTNTDTVVLDVQSTFHSFTMSYVLLTWTITPCLVQASSFLDVLNELYLTLCTQLYLLDLHLGARHDTVGSVHALLLECSLCSWDALKGPHMLANWARRTRQHTAVLTTTQLDTHQEVSSVLDETFFTIDLPGNTDNGSMEESGY